MRRLGHPGRELFDTLFRASADQEVDAEFAFHLAMGIRDGVARGLSPGQARQETLDRFGDLRRVRIQCTRIARQRDTIMRRTEYLDEVWQDLRYAFRTLRRTPLATAVMLGTLAIGIGATTTIFSVLDRVVLRPFPIPEAGRVVYLFEQSPNGEGDVSVGNFIGWKEQTSTLTDLTAMNVVDLNLEDGDTPTRIGVAEVTSSYFSLLRVAPLRGRAFGPNVDTDADAAASGVVVLSERLWRGPFGSDTTLVGRTVHLSGTSYTVLGIMPAEFDPDLAGYDAWVPLTFSPAQRANHDGHYLGVLGRLAPGRSRAEASTDLSRIQERLSESFPIGNDARVVSVRTMPDLLLRNYRDQLWFALGAVCLVLLIACANVASLLLARGAGRQTELAVRSALGAGRRRIIRQLLTEAGVVGLAGGMGGLLLAIAGVPLIVRLAPTDIPRLAGTTINLTALLFALLLSLIATFLFGSLPALIGARRSSGVSLREGRQARPGPQRGMRVLIIGGEVALALSLLVASGLLVRSLVHLQGVSPGYDQHNLIAARVSLPPTRYPDGPSLRSTFERILGAVRAIPGVTSAALVSQAPLGEGGSSNGLFPTDRPLERENMVIARLRYVSDGYFATMAIPLVQGRRIEPSDTRSQQPIGVVTVALAEDLWSVTDAIGHAFICCGGPSGSRTKAVVGVVADVRSSGAARAIAPEFYLPMAQIPDQMWGWNQQSMTLVVRSPIALAALVPTLRTAVQSIDPALPLFSITTLDEAVDRTVAGTRFTATLLTTLAIIGLLLAMAGVYGVISYLVNTQRHDIGIRLALGATPHHVRKLILRQGMYPVFLGIGAGLLIAGATTRLLVNALHGISPFDPLTLLAVTLVVLLGGVLAIVVPSRRASRIQATSVLDGL